MTQLRATKRTDPLTNEELVAVWKRIVNRPRAREYVRALASQAYDTKRAAYVADGKRTAQALSDWRHIPGFKDLENAVFEDPLVAARFMALLGWASALDYQHKVLAGKEQGSKSAASRYIIHSADPILRKVGPPETPGVTPPPVEKKRLEDMLRATEGT